MSEKLCRRVRQGNWMQPPDWLPDGQAPSDCLGDLRTQDNDLSVYVVDSQASVERVAVALVARSQRIEHFDYLLFDLALIDGLGITVDPTDGGTPDHAVNRWHRDLANFSASSLTTLAERLWNERRQMTKGRVHKRTVDEQLQESVKNKTLDWDEIDPHIQKDLAARGIGPPR